MYSNIGLSFRWTLPLMAIFKKLSDYVCQIFALFKATGTQDLILLKVVSLDRSWLVGLTDDL
jgi:hypothetical protein